MDKNIHQMRQDYRFGELTEEHVAQDPIDQFRVWFDQVRTTDQPEPNAMTLATVSDNQPSVRVVLLKHFDQDGFVFFTDYESRKGVALAQQPLAALCFWWHAVERQVRIEGQVERVAPEMSDEYFHSRPRGSQISASVSQQSRVVPNRDHLEKAATDYAAQYAEQTLPRPARWGGYRLVPTRIEFWQGRSNRLHDRLCYTREGANWRIERLAP